MHKKARVTSTETFTERGLLSIVAAIVVMG
jgi:hypothetical protein